MRIRNCCGLLLAVTAPVPTAESKTLPLSRRRSKVGPLPDVDYDSPHFLVEDDAFPSRTWLMKPFADGNI